MKKKIKIGDYEKRVLDLAPCEYEPPDDRTLKKLCEEDYYKSYSTGRGSDA